MKLKNIRFLFAFILVCLSLAVIPERRSRAQSDQSASLISYQQLRQQSAAAGEDLSGTLTTGFVIKGSENGSSCRSLTEREALQMRINERRSESNTGKVNAGDRAALALLKSIGDSSRCRRKRDRLSGAEGNA